MFLDEKHIIINYIACYVTESFKNSDEKNQGGPRKYSQSQGLQNKAYLNSYELF